MDTIRRQQEIIKTSPVEVPKAAVTIKEWGIKFLPEQGGGKKEI